MEPPSEDELETYYRNALETAEDPYRHPETKREAVATAELVLDKRLSWELNELRRSIDVYRYWSRRLSIALVGLSVALLVVSLVQLYLSSSG